jgi:hypothetical protein
MTKRCKEATNRKTTLSKDMFQVICLANSKRSNLIISNSEEAGKDVWLFFGNIGNAVIGEGYFLKAKGDPYKTNGGHTYTGPICGIATNENTDIAIVEY